MDYDMLESFSTGCDLLAGISEPFFDDNLKTTKSDVFLNTGLPEDDYNILNLDSFVPKETFRSNFEEDAFNSAKYVDPNIFLLDVHDDRFEELLQSEIIEKATGNVVQITKSGSTLSIAGVPLKFECMNCEQLFDYEAHLHHVCEFDSNKERIVDDSDHFDVFEGSKTTKLLRDNSAQLKGLLNDIRDENSENKGNKSHVCTICNRSYVHGTGLVRHMKTHNVQQLEKYPKRMFAAAASVKPIDDVTVVCQCLFCGRIFSSVSDALEHYDEMHAFDVEERPNALLGDGEDCEDASTSTKAPDASKGDADYVAAEPESTEDENLIKPVVIESKLRCEFCDFAFLDMANLFQHQISHNPADGYECAYCSITSLTAKTLSNHWASDCAFELYEKKRHINVRMLYACNVCENKFPTLDELYDHRYSAYHFFPRWNVILGALQIGCEKCGVFFTKATDLLNHHNETHSRTAKKASETCRPYLCEVCGKGYTQSSHLYQHLRFHQGIKPFGCTKAGCTRRFTIRPDLNDHIRKCHTGERPYHCTECGKSFLTGSVYYQHRLIHRGERRYKCNSCEKRFHRSDALKNHERIHSGDKPFPCSVCAKKFRQKGDRDKHLRSRHRNQDLNAIKSEATAINPHFYKNIMNVMPSIKNIDGIDILSMVNSS